uniref:CSON001074 protein n=1 Tax=Culicoides sonorensis TaxID=179676 RepID=A0A336MIH9_CULSO
MPSTIRARVGFYKQRRPWEAPRTTTTPRPGQEGGRGPTHGRPIPRNRTNANRIAITSLDNALATATAAGAVLVAEIQISPSGTATVAGSNNATTTTIIKTANNPPPGTTTVQAVAQQMRLSPLQSSHASNSTGGRDITSSGSGVMTAFSKIVQTENAK